MGVRDWEKRASESVLPRTVWRGGTRGSLWISRRGAGKAVRASVGCVVALPRWCECWKWKAKGWAMHVRGADLPLRRVVPSGRSIFRDCAEPFRFRLQFIPEWAITASDGGKDLSVSSAGALVLWPCVNQVTYCFKMCLNIYLLFDIAIVAAGRTRQKLTCLIKRNEIYSKKNISMLQEKRCMPP